MTTEYDKYWLMTAFGTFVSTVPLSKQAFYDALSPNNVEDIFDGVYTIVADADKALVELDLDHFNDLNVTAQPKKRGRKNVLDV